MSDQRDITAEEIKGHLARIEKRLKDIASTLIALLFVVSIFVGASLAFKIL